MTPHALRFTLVPLLITSGLLSACSSSTLYRHNRQEIAEALTAIDEGSYQSAVKRMETMLAETSTESDTYRLQRAFGAYLISRAHLLASIGRPFLRESTNSPRMFEAASGERGLPSAVRHLVASHYYANYAMEWSSKEAPASRIVDGERLLPEEFDSFSLEQAETAMAFAQLAIYSQLKFQDRIENVLQGADRLVRLEQCEQLLDESRVDAAIRPWIYLAIFEHLRPVNEISAYGYAIRALQTSSDTGKFTPTDDWTEKLTRWVTTDSAYEFKCPRCGQVVIPEFDRCAQCKLIPILEFRPEQRDSE